MREISPTYYRYKTHLKKGRRDGLIVGDYGPMDFYGYLPDKLDATIGMRFGALRVVNTRGLPSVAGKIIDYIAVTQKKVDFLELGSGAGHAAFTAYETAKDRKAEITVETVSFSPMSPWLGLTQDIKEIREEIRKLMLAGKLTLEEEEVLKPQLQMPHSDCRIPLDVVLELQERYGVEFFRETKEPWVQKQHLQDFNTLDLGNRRFDMIYENNGPIIHSPKSARGEDKAIAHLNPEGIFIVTPFSVPYCVQDERGKPRDFRGALVIVDGMKGETLMTSPQSEMATRLAPYLPACRDPHAEGYRAGENIFVVPNLENIVTKSFQESGISLATYKTY